MNNLLSQIEDLTEQISEKWNETDSLVSKTVTQMAKLNLELAENFFMLLKAGKTNTARIIARPIYERSLFLKFILHDRREISSRALLFYHSSRLRQYLWLSYIINDPKTFSDFKTEEKAYQKQNALLLRKEKMPLKKWVSYQIGNEKEAFNRIEELVKYCDISKFDKDERRKTWYRLDPDTFGGDLKILTLSDVSRYVLNDNTNYYYYLFYGIDSLFTHGYMITDIFPREANEFQIALLKLCLGNLNALAEFLNLTPIQNKQLSELNHKISNLRTNPFPLKLAEFNAPLNDHDLLTKFTSQVQQNFDAYQLLANKGNNYALHVLLRTLNEQVLSWKWMQVDHPQNRIKLFALTSQIQTLSDLFRLAPTGSNQQRQISQIRRDKKEFYDQLATDVMYERSYKKDKQKRRWFIIENNDDIVHSMRQLEHRLLNEDGNFSYLYGNGFLSVHVHGINLELPFRVDGQPVFLLSGVSDSQTCHQVTQRLWDLFKENR